MKPESNMILDFVKKTTILFFVGMAGCGKTTLVHRISIDLNLLKKNHYIINLDPATRNIPYTANIDIRDTINFKKVMKDYLLGPNGAILTSLNLFSTRFDQVQKLIQNVNTYTEFVLIDTPGQIEIFTWSASGSIITETFSRNFPVILFYIVDIARTAHPITFVSNILYSCSILYKTRLPILLLLNKADITSIDFLREWLIDHESFDQALEKENFFAGSFARSLAFTIDIFHKKIPFLTLSALTGIGSMNIIQFIKKIWNEFAVSFQTELENSMFFHLRAMTSRINTKKNMISKEKKNSIIHSKETGQDDTDEKETNNFFSIFEFIATLHLENDKIYSLTCK